MLPQLFHRKSTEPAKDIQAVTRVEMELVLARFDRLESQIKRIEMEWNDTYDKIAHLYDRTRKRIQALKRAEDRSNGTSSPEDTPEPSAPKTHAEILSMARGRGMIA